MIDGHDITPLLLSKSTESTREAHYYFLNYQLQAVRQGPWKLALMKQPEALGGEPPQDNHVNPRLYDLASDIGERTNVADKHPEMVTRLQALASEMEAEIGGQSPTSRRPAGNVSNPVPLYPMMLESRASKPVNLAKLTNGDTVDSASTPAINDRPFTISFDVETDQADAVLVAQGGASAGFAVYLRDSRLVFAIRYGAKDQIAEIVADQPLSKAKRVSRAYRKIAP